MRTFRIRVYRPVDRDDVARLWHDAWLATGHGTAQDPTLDQYRERLGGEGRGWQIRVACVDDAIVGFVAFQAAEGWLRQLFVDPSMKRHGIGTRLLDEAKHAMPGGFHLRTDAGNRQARRFYEARGLHCEGEAPHPQRGHPIAMYRWP